MRFLSVSIAALGFAVHTYAHMLMAQPVPYGKSTLTNAPLAADGSDFPCKQRTGVYDAEGANNQIALGSTQPLTFIGSATHGGGSCQISITYDQQPTKNSVWKVIHSIEGGCPVRNQAGNLGDDANAPDPDTYSFPVPTTLPTGTATLAWTWFNKVGNREMYMNCAPITLTGGSSKRSDDDEFSGNATMLMERDQSAYNALPNMFVANIGNGCGTVDSTDVLFPDPGDSVEQDGLSTKSALSTPTGTACGAVVSPSVAASAGSAPAATTSAPSAANATPDTAAASSAPTATAVSAPAGGVFATVVSAPAAASSVAPAAVAPSSVAVDPSPTPGAASSPAAAAPSAAPAAASSSASSSSGSTTGSGTAIAAGTACTTEGMWNCIGGSSFQRCASGQWSVVQSVAAGTTCDGGQSMAISIKAVKIGRREVRFSEAHKMRHQ